MEGEMDDWGAEKVELNKGRGRDVKSRLMDSSNLQQMFRSSASRWGVI